MTHQNDANTGADSSKIHTVVRPAQDPDVPEEAVRILRANGAVVMPTDTVYGVGCDPWSPAAIERLYEIKLRPKQMAIPILLSAKTVEAARPVTQALDSGPKAEAFAALAERFWPGGLTIVVPAHPDLPPTLTAYRPTVALRMPDEELALRLIAAMGGALAVTSANISGEPAATTAQEALAQLNGRVELIIDGGTCAGGVASTIVDIVSSPPRLLRRGAIPIDILRQVLPDLAIGDE